MNSIDQTNSSNPSPNDSIKTKLYHFLYSALFSKPALVAAVVLTLAVIALAVALESVALLVTAGGLMLCCETLFRYRDSVVPNDVATSDETETVLSNDYLIQTFATRHGDKIATLYNISQEPTFPPTLASLITGAIRDRLETAGQGWFREHLDTHGDKAEFWDALHRSIPCKTLFDMISKQILSDPRSNYLVLCNSHGEARGMEQRMRKEVFPLVPLYESHLRDTAVFRSHRSKKPIDGYVVLDATGDDHSQRGYIDDMDCTEAVMMDTGLGRSPVHPSVPPTILTDIVVDNVSVVTEPSDPLCELRIVERL